MKPIAFITNYEVIDKIIHHLRVTFTPLNLNKFRGFSPMTVTLVLTELLACRPV